MSDTIRWCYTHDTRWYENPCGGSEHDDDCDVALVIRADQPIYRIEYMDNPEDEGACMECNADGIKYVRIGAETDEHDGECDCVGCEKTRMGWT